MIWTIFSNRAVKEWKETYFWSLKKSRGMMALLSLLMFIGFPVIILISFANKTQPSDWEQAFSRNAYGLSMFLVTPLLLLFTLVISASLFHYLHEKRSVDLFHSLPVGRIPMLLGRWCAALTVLFVPMLVNYAVVSVIGFSYGISPQYCIAGLWLQILYIILMVTAALTFSVFMAICTGTTFDMIISILAINIAYPLLVYSVNVFAPMLLPGLQMDIGFRSLILSALAPFLAACIPFVNSYFGQEEYLGTESIAWWVAMTFILLVSSLFLYRRRKSESAESNFAFPIPKIVIRFMVTAVSGLGFGMILHSFTSSTINFFIGLVLGSIAAHIAVEAIYSRGFKQMKRSFAYYGLFIAAFAVLYGTLAFGCFGYDTRVPLANDVQSISVSVPSAYSVGNSNIYDENHRLITTISSSVKQAANIQKIIEQHKNFVNSLHNSSFPYQLGDKFYSYEISLAYHLKNGMVMNRSYQYMNENSNQTPYSGLTELNNQITQMEEVIASRDLLFYIEPNQIKSVEFIKEKQDSITYAPDDSQKEELLEAIRQDCLESKSIVQNKDSDHMFIIDFKESFLPGEKMQEVLGNYKGNVNLDPRTIVFNESFTHTIAVLKKFAWDK